MTNREQVRGELHDKTNRLKAAFRAAASGQSMKLWARGQDEGAAWLERKKFAKNPEAPRKSAPPPVAAAPAKSPSPGNRKRK